MELGLKGEDVANDVITCLLGSHRPFSFLSPVARQLLRDKTAVEASWEAILTGGRGLGRLFHYSSFFRIRLNKNGLSYTL